MINSQMTREQHQAFQEWISTEWDRCATLRVTLENHALTYLTTTNGGGAAAVIAFAGSAAYATRLVYYTLGVFVAGLLFAGFAIIAGYYKAQWITQCLGEDHRLFNAGGMHSDLVEQRHHSRFKRHSYGPVFGWISLLLLIAGIALSVASFSEFLSCKQDKENSENIATDSPVPMNPLPSKEQPRQPLAATKLKPTSRREQ